MTRRRVKGIMWKSIADKIRERDRNTCRKCWKKIDNKMPVHHLIPFCVSGRNREEELITLCQKCHMEEENLYRRYGIAGWAKRQLKINIQLQHIYSSRHINA